MSSRRKPNRVGFLFDSYKVHTPWTPLNSLNSPEPQQSIPSVTVCSHGWFGLSCRHTRSSDLAFGLGNRCRCGTSSCWRSVASPVPLPDLSPKHRACLSSPHLHQSAEAFLYHEWPSGGFSDFLSSRVSSLRPSPNRRWLGSSR
eukprot:3933647-Rhodomonas_salina.2